MKVLVVGSGGREHALCWAISKSPKCEKLYAAPGNAGIADVAECVKVKADDVDGIVKFAKSEKIDFVVVGPEAPLVDGLVDKLDKAKIKAFGPSKKAAQLEGSKAFMKDLLAKYEIPTADYGVFDEPDAAKEYIIKMEGGVVVKADGLAAGKGVIVCHNKNEAFAAIDHIMTERAFGDAGDEVLVEEFMKGEEISFFALVDGTTAVPMGAAQDHKAVHEGDTGPNTGGMGAYTPTPLVDKAMEKKIMAEIIQPTIEAMAAEDAPYKGVLFAGLMVENGVPRVLEYNVRFGDPECQVLMARMNSDVLEALVACADGKLKDAKITWKRSTALIVVMAADGYPGHYATGTQISKLDEAQGVKGVEVFHAGTKQQGKKVVANGGRVLGVTSIGKTVKEAQDKAYEAVDAIEWPEGFCRRDIGWRAVEREEA
ncbi:phosphoribosylamine--glycine ligase [Magnetovibrio sp. PR-2]|uniref:phosphoribosylamine--glycine ligase n=1 Tax=Magnetovibrio sp. PR-2 TaxID=3120356 RepID=UPI002FCE58E8